MASSAESKPAFALVGEPGTRKYVGSAFVSVNREMRERLWKRVQEHAGEAPKDMKKRPATQWVKPGIKACVKHLAARTIFGTPRFPRLWED
ncbi:hypothetical protein [Mesorhizobium delmotii]|uniref:ATP-dependent DNA ligase n=1 Tax=Mesorhizobium delmotii TaxID=1631247 RepID=A0A2P9ATG3_9HYPH|nr:hypothetical protein [Mesorhizobium delmotii]SJM34406.1 hypothetical protein BQ8482_420056 [Mesorhizobium delmotii]